MSYDPLYIRFLFHFNVDRNYYECHEVMEELWMEENRNRLFQGLLQVAVGLYHARNNNTSGASKMLAQAVSKLELYPDHQLGIDMVHLLQGSQEYIKKLQQHEPTGPSFEFYDLDIIIIDHHLADEVSSYTASTLN